MPYAHSLDDLRRITITYITWNNLLCLGAIIFLELHVTRLFNTSEGLVVESIGVGVVRITNKNTLDSSSFEFTESLPFVLDEAFAPKDAKVPNIWLVPREKLIWNLVVHWAKEEPVGCMNRGRDGFPQKIMGRLELIKHCSFHLNERAVLPLHYNILLRGVRYGELMLDPLILNELGHGVVLELGPIVGPNGLDHFTMLTLSLLGEGDEVLVGFIFGLEKEHPSVP